MPAREEGATSSRLPWAGRSRHHAGFDHQDRAGGFADDFLGHAAHQQPLEARAAVAADHQQVAIDLRRQLHDFRSGPALKTALNSPWDLLLHNDKVYIAMAGHHQIWLYDPVQGRGMAMIFQTFALYPHLTVKDNLAYPLREAKVDRKEIERRVAEVAGMLRITHTLARKPGTASGSFSAAISRLAGM